MFKSLIAGAILLFATNAYATPEYLITPVEVTNIETEEVHKAVWVFGTFQDGIVWELEKTLDKHPEVDTVLFHSPGGVAASGYAMGELLSDREMKVWVPRGRVCVSACAIAFLGGKDYKIGGQLLFHNAWIAEEDRIQIFDSSEAFDAVYNRAQWIGGYNLFYTLANGFSADLAFAVYQNTGPSRYLAFFNEADLMEYYVRDDNATGGGQLHDYFVRSTDNMTIVEDLDIQTTMQKQLTDIQENPRYTIKVLTDE